MRLRKQKQTSKRFVLTLSKDRERKVINGNIWLATCQGRIYELFLGFTFPFKIIIVKFTLSIFVIIYIYHYIDII